MSVLIEALSVVVPRSVLDASWPGGAEAFLEHCRAPEAEARYALADRFLVVASFLAPDEAQRTIRALGEHGIEEPEDESGSGELAFLDQHMGPAVPCAWLEWRKQDEGYTHAWLAGTEPGALVAPEGWSPEQSLTLVRHDLREEPGRMMRIGEEDGLEIWLDFKTGRQIAAPPLEEDEAVEGEEAPESGFAPPQPFDPDAEGEEDDEGEEGEEGEQPEPRTSTGRKAEPGTLLDVVQRALTAHGWQYHTLDDAPLVHFTVVGSAGTYPCWAAVNDDAEQCSVFVVFPHRVAADRRAAVAELLTRANYGLAIGSFEMDFSDGELRFRVSVDVEGGTLTTTMVQTMFDAALWTMERFHDPVMRVVYGGIAPEQALEGLDEEEG